MTKKSASFDLTSHITLILAVKHNYLFLSQNTFVKRYENTLRTT